MVKKTKIKEKEIKKEKTHEVRENNEEIEEDIEEAEEAVKKLGEKLNRENNEEIKEVTIKGSKPLSSLKKGDKIKVDGKEYEIDTHYILMDHGKTKEIVIEIFDEKTDKDFQLRYFSDQVERSMEFYELQEILYVKKEVKKLEW